MPFPLVIRQSARVPAGERFGKRSCQIQVKTSWALTSYGLLLVHRQREGGGVR